MSANDVATGASERTPRPSTLATPEPEPTATLCWLSRRLLLLSIASTDRVGVKVFAICEGKTVELAARGMQYARPGGADRAISLKQAVLVQFPTSSLAEESPTLAVRWGKRSIRLDPDRAARATVPLDRLLRNEFAPLAAVERANLLAFLVAGPKSLAGTAQLAQRAVETHRPEVATERTEVPDSAEDDGLQLSESLSACRQALRERMPAGMIAVGAAQGLHIDAILAVDDQSFYMQGWMHDQHAVTTRLTAVSPEGSRTEMLPRLFLHRRPDVEQFYGDDQWQQRSLTQGWIAHVAMPDPSRLNGGWTFEMCNSAGHSVEVSGPIVTREMTTIRDQILRDLVHERLPADFLRTTHIAPALALLEARRHSFTHVASINQHGQPPRSPDVTIVVPLYGRIDFMEHQLAQFVHDPELEQADIVYVLDSPELAEPFRAAAAQLAELYSVPFRAVVLSHNIGFAGVNNIGGQLARGRLLLLLNSDVLPSEPGWLGAMTAFYDCTADIGVLAPKLLYEDDSIQHAGLYFRQLADSRLWNNEHYYKGLARTLPAANVAREVPAVTAACMMIDLALYRKLGGLRGMYIQGDYEDSDLCLRLSEAGRRIWYLPSVELYHLEGQSYPSHLRQLAGDYNRWLHTSTWNSRLTAYA